MTFVAGIIFYSAYWASASLRGLEARQPGVGCEAGAVSAPRCFLGPSLAFLIDVLVSFVFALVMLGFYFLLIGLGCLEPNKHCCGAASLVHVRFKVLYGRRRWNACWVHSISLHRASI